MSALLKTGHYIDGQWLSGGPAYAVNDPASGERIADVPRGGAEETNQAIDAAQRALPAWRALTAKERSVRLRRWSDLMLANQRELATLLSREQGKPLAEAMGEVVYAASFLEWFGEEAKRVYGDVIPSPKADSRIVVIKEPVGVVAAITPWNFPLAMVTRKVGPALAAGCTMILKPSEETPLSAFALAVLAEQAGIPAGVFNVVSGDAVAIGGALQASGIVRKLSFTGSTRTGKLLMRQAADTLKKVSLELGGNAPFIVFDDADLDAAVKGAMASKFRNTGQTCVCVNRFFIQDGVYEAFTGKLAEAVAAMRVGSALDGETEQGPLINAAVLGAADMISMVIRASFVQLETPDEMRGRVSAVNGLFIGASNQLGEFESGITAHWFGTVPAVVMGGIGTLLVTGVWIKLFPTLANRDRMHVPVEEPKAEAAKV